MTWAFGVRCAILPAAGPSDKGFWHYPGELAADLAVSVRQPRSSRAARHTSVRAGSRDDPEVLAFLDHPGAEDHDPTRRALVEEVQADLVLDGIDQVPEQPAR